MATKRRKKQYRWRRRLRAGLVIVPVILLGFWLDSRLRPVICEFARVQARLLAVVTINRSVEDSLRRSPVDTAGLLTVQYDKAGDIVSVDLDSSVINRLASQLTLDANRDLQALQQKTISVPLGTVLGWQIFGGRGPALAFQVLPTSYAESAVYSTLQEAGINQALHTVYLRFTVEVTAFIPGFITSQTVTSDVVLAQQVIVGRVPDFYDGTYQ